MREWLRKTLLNSFSLFLVGAVYPGLIIPASLVSLLEAGFTFTLLNFLAKPVIKLLLLPLNLLTLGLLSWLSQVLVLVIAAAVLPQLAVVPARIGAFSRDGFSLPAFYLNPVLSFIAASLLLSAIYQLLEWALWQE